MTNNTTDETNVIKATDVKIFPERILKPETTEKILNEILALDGVLRVLVNGESLPKLVSMGPAKGLPTNHSDRKSIKIKNEEVQLLVSVGEIILTVNLDNLEDFVEKTEEILEETLNFNYDVSVGIFTKSATSVTDYMKYGEGFEDKVDSRVIGLVDPTTKSSETVKYIR
ncbi:MAG: methyl-coenzyme M reductase operon protein D [Methanobacteriaceae archaeon]|nr:methyl-coenzyme M reductase operon protein D [Methanobacteriaceae archaeon]